MNVQTSIYPNAGDEPQGYINPGAEGGHPFAVLYFETGRTGPWLSLGQLSDDDAVAYLDHLADLASGLATKIRLAQQPAASWEVTRAACEAAPLRPGGTGSTTGGAR